MALYPAKVIFVFDYDRKMAVSAVELPIKRMEITFLSSFQRSKKWEMKEKGKREADSGWIKSCNKTCTYKDAQKRAYLSKVIANTPVLCMQWEIVLAHGYSAGKGLDNEKVEYLSTGEIFLLAGVTWNVQGSYCRPTSL